MSLDDVDNLERALRELAASADDRPSPPPRGQALDCPVCGQSMDHMETHGITLDVCDRHGAWFDQGEVALLIDKAYRAGKAHAGRKPGAPGGQDSMSDFKRGMNRVTFYLGQV